MPLVHSAKRVLRVTALLLLSLLFAISTTSASTVLAAANGFGWD